MQAAKMRDQTGLRFVGRSLDGRYVYESVSVLGRHNRVQLTNQQRIGLALLKALADKMVPGTRVYPMTVENGSHIGYGVYGGSTIWINRPTLGRKDPARMMDLFTHELGHNAQPYASKPHGKEFERERCRLVSLAKKVTMGYTQWPKLDMRKLRDSLPPSARKRVRVRI